MTPMSPPAVRLPAEAPAALRPVEAPTALQPNQPPTALQPNEPHTATPTAPASLGASVRRTDARPKVLGETRYGADMHVPGMLYACVVRAEHPHANVLGIDCTQAKALAHELRDQAVAHLAGFGERGRRLTELADFVIRREF